MSADTEVLEAEEVTELVVRPVTPATLFRTDDPVLVLERATEVANALADVIQRRKLFVNISGKSHVLVEGWLTLGSMLGVTPVCEWTRPIEGGWEARVIAQTLDGRQIGAAEAQCLSTEKRGPWKSSEDYAIRSMAQTRATSKALASVLRFVVTLAGYEGTPAEEAEGTGRAGASKPSAPEKALDPERVKAILAAIKDAGWSYKQISLAFGSAGAEAQAINRADSIEKAVRNLTSEQADQFEAELETDG